MVDQKKFLWLRTTSSQPSAISVYTPTTFRQGWHRFRELLGQQVDGASLAVFRICFGVVMFLHSVKYLYPQGSTSLKDYLYHETTCNFTYPGFNWVQPFPEPLWTLFFCLMGLAALGVALGVCYRACAATLCVSYTYIFLSELAKYNNHYYLMCLFALLLAVMPADRRFSVAAWWRRRDDLEKEDSLLVPFWTVFLLRAQLFVVYFFGGIAKLDADWLTGVPMLGKGRELLNYWSPLLGLPEIDALWLGMFICWFGLIYDLSIGFLLLVRRTRLLGIVLTLGFHVGNHFLFPIGLFPLMAFTTTLIFFEPDWPLRCFNWLRRPRFAKPEWRWARIGLFILPPIGILLGWKDRISGYSRTKQARLQPWVVGFVTCYLLVQIVVPFRHAFIAGDAKWTEEGQDFSWRMMLRTKDASHVIFHVVDSEMLSIDRRGNMQFNWSRWPEERPKTLYVPIDSSRFNWNHDPGLTTTFEPNAGLRVIYHLSSGEDAKVKSQQLARQWKKLFGRDVSVSETIGFDEALRKLEEHFANSESQEELQESIQRMRRLMANLSDQSQLSREYELASIGREIDALLHTKEESFVRSIARRLHPFLVQGALFPQERFLVVDDLSFTAETHDLEKLTGGQECLVWMDLGRLRPADWKKLPQWFVTFENRELRVVWNYMDELNHIQKRRFTTCPWMIRQFAAHIADRWEQESGRRPMIRVVSNLMMNYRIPQPMIDPNIDLASVGYKLLSHNEWILPLNAAVGSARGPVQTADGSEHSRR